MSMLGLLCMLCFAFSCMLCIITLMDHDMTATWSEGVSVRVLVSFSCSCCSLRQLYMHMRLAALG